jgi:hypothetical protein
MRIKRLIYFCSTAPLALAFILAPAGVHETKAQGQAAGQIHEISGSVLSFVQSEDSSFIIYLDDTPLGIADSLLLHPDLLRGCGPGLECPDPTPTPWPTDPPPPTPTPTPDPPCYPPFCSGVSLIDDRTILQIYSMPSPAGDAGSPR